MIELIDESRPSWDEPGKGRPVRVTLWEPAEFDGRVLLVSHGTGAAARDMAWLAEPLAASGFLVASVDHHGNNRVSGYRAPGFVCIFDRPADMSFALSWLSGRYEISWAGAAGFSAGGYTSAALLGARLDREVLDLLLSGAVPAPRIPEFPEAFDWLATLDEDGRRELVERACGDFRDERVSAAYLICPGESGVTDEASLRGIERPVMIRWGGADVVAPPAVTALRYLRHIPGATGSSLGDEVEHGWLFPDNPAGCRHVRPWRRTRSPSSRRGLHGRLRRPAV